MVGDKKKKSLEKKEKEEGEVGIKKSKGKTLAYILLGVLVIILI